MTALRDPEQTANSGNLFAANPVIPPAVIGHDDVSPSHYIAAAPATLQSAPAGSTASCGGGMMEFMTLY